MYHYNKHFKDKLNQLNNGEKWEIIKAIAGGLCLVGFIALYAIILIIK